MTSFQKKLLGGTLAAVILITVAAAVTLGPIALRALTGKPSTPAGGPRAGTCWATNAAAAVTFLLGYDRQVDCSQQHVIESAYVGERGDQSEPDMVSSCSDRVKEFLGDRYEAAQIQMYVRREARWYSCDLAVVKSLDGNLAGRTGSLKGKAADLAITCGAARYEQDQVEDLDWVTCQSGHDTEFSGLYTISAGNLPDDDEALGQAILSGCLKTTAKYLGWSDDELEESEQLAYWYWGADLGQAKLGYRTFKCFASTYDEGTLTASVKNIGTGTLPLK
ncbi:septum formation family protein [Longispora albida]|uniref:septum formation family protein n=1 Tax=Longispora albida TaxID=203523 RepID=UPI00036B540D|nr:septum formation family protein [Longispora albida]